jgi:asparagine synthetase B (glutamine-hydrolysing)
MTGFENFSAADLKARELLQHTESFNKIAVNQNSVNFFENTGIDYATASRQYACKIESKVKLLNKDLVLFYSGGVDSEFMCNIFRDAGVEFKIVFFDYNGLNDYDKMFADMYVKEHNLEVITEKFDVAEFMTDIDLLKEMSVKYNKTSPQILAYHRMIELISEKYNAFCVLAGELRGVYSGDTLTGYINWQKGTPSDDGCPGGGNSAHYVDFPDCHVVFIE